METETLHSRKSHRAAFAHSPRVMLLIALATLGVVIAADAFTPYELGFSAFYVLPVLIAAWGLGWSRGLLFAFLCAGLWYGVDWTSGPHYSHEFYRVWDAFNHLMAFALVAIVTGKLRDLFLREQALSEELALTLKNVRELEGLLPMCAWCKKIRDDEGYWQELEAYLSLRTKASFSHGICPNCAKAFFQEAGEQNTASRSDVA